MLLPYRPLSAAFPKVRMQENSSYLHLHFRPAQIYQKENLKLTQPLNERGGFHISKPFFFRKDSLCQAPLNSRLLSCIRNLAWLQKRGFVCASTL